MFPGWVLQVRVLAVCQCLGVRWLFAVWVQCGPLGWDSLDVLWVRSCAGGDDEGHRGECTWWDEEDVDLVFDVSPVSAVYLNKGTTVIWSRNVTHLMGFGLGSWKESTLSHLVGICLLAFGGSWNDDPSWHSGFKWAQFLLYFLLLGPLIMYEHPRSKISTTVPVNHFSFATVLLLRKESNLFFHFQNSLVLGLVSSVEVFFLHLLNF